MTIVQLIGIAGFLTYLASFGALQLRMIDGNGTLYAVMNILAASLVLVSMIEEFNLASTLISVSWIIIGFVGLGWRFVKKLQGPSQATRLQPLK